MKTYSPEALAALDSGEAVVTSAARIATAPTPVLAWGGYGEIVIGGETYLGLGDMARVTAMSGKLGAGAQGLEIVLSPVAPEVAALFELPGLRGAPIVLRELIFDRSGAVLLASNVELRGRVDRARRRESAGGDVTVTLTVEGAARGLGRARVRMRSDADQRLFAPTDSAFRRVAFAAQKELTLGGEPPRKAGSAAGGSWAGTDLHENLRPYAGASSLS